MEGQFASYKDAIITKKLLKELLCSVRGLSYLGHNPDIVIDQDHYNIQTDGYDIP